MESLKPPFVQNCFSVYWAAAEGGGKTYRVNLGGGGETYCRVCSPKPLLEASEIGVGRSVPLSFKGNDRESPKKGGENVS